MPTYQYSAESVGSLPVSNAAAFEFLDDHLNLSSHMSKSSWMMLGTTMDIFMDEFKTRAIGSKFGFTGRIAHIPLSVHEVVTRRQPPNCKAWETVGEPTLWVIGRYEMGFDLTQAASTTGLRVYIKYDRPIKGLARALSSLFHGAYARWCTRMMVKDAERHFAAIVS
jgi:hypothetical protein